MNDHAKHRLLQATVAIDIAVVALRGAESTMREFIKEARLMESAGPILAPGLYLDSERRAVNAVVEPTFKAALDFLDIFDAQKVAARDALAKATR